MFRVKQARILLPHQLFHHGKHVVLAFVDEHSVAMICPEPLLMSAGGSFGCKRQPDARLLSHRHHCLEEVSDVVPHLVERMLAFAFERRQILYAHSRTK
jgi:hypothetical protein